MTNTARFPNTFDVILIILWVLAFIGLLIDLLGGAISQASSSFLLFAGLGSVLQWRRYRSRRWRTLAWVFFSLAFASLLYRLGQWAGWVGQ